MTINCEKTSERGREMSYPFYMLSEMLGMGMGPWAELVSNVLDYICF